MYNVEVVEDELEAAAARAAMDQSGKYVNTNEPRPRSLIRINAVRLPSLLQVEKLIANSMDPDQTVWMRRLVWIHAGRKPIMLVLS
jgi:hypothetical protein